MGDRAIVLIHNDETVSPTIYLHWAGRDVPRLIETLATLMHGRHGDSEYAAARLVGIVHEQTPGNLSLGMWSNTLSLADLGDPMLMARLSLGDAGVVVVNCFDFSWRAYGGYLKNWKPEPATNAA